MWWPTGNVTWTIYFELSFPLPKEALHKNLALIGQAVLEKKIFENGCHIHEYSPGAVADNPLGSFFSLTHLFSQFSPLL